MWVKPGSHIATTSGVIKNSTVQEVKNLARLSCQMGLGFGAQIVMSLTDVAAALSISADAFSGIIIGTAVYDFVSVALIGIIVAQTGAVTTGSVVNPGQKTAQHSLIATGVIAGVAGLVCMLTVSAVLIWAGHPYLDAAKWLRPASFGMVPFLSFVGLRTLALAADKISRVTVLLVAAVPFNALASYYLGHGHGSIPGMGAGGIGLASALTWSPVLAASAFRLEDVGPGISASLQAVLGSALSRSDLYETLKSGLLVSGRVLLGEGLWPVSTLLVAVFAAPYVGLHGLILQAVYLSEGVALSLSSASTVRVALTWAENLVERRVTVVNATLLCALFCGIGVFMSSFELLSLLSNKPSFVEIFNDRKYHALIVVLGCLVSGLNLALVVVSGALIGASDTVTALRAGFLGPWGIGLCLGGVIFALCGDPRLLWAGVFLGYFLAVVVCVRRLVCLSLEIRDPR